MTRYTCSFDGSCLDNHISGKQKRDCFGAWTIKRWSDMDTEEKVFPVTANSSNQAEYEALLDLLRELHKRQFNKNDELEIIGDSQLVVHQVNGDFDCKNPRLKPRRDMARDLLSELPIPYTLNQIDRDHNPAGRLMEKKLKMLRVMKAYGNADSLLS